MTPTTASSTTPPPAPLFYDADGNGPGAQVQFATLTGTSPIAAGDFTVI